MRHPSGSRRLYAAALMLLFALALSVPARTFAQTAPPTLAAFSFGPNTVDVTQAAQVITFQAHVLDPTGGLQVAQMSITSPDGYSHGVTFAGQAGAATVTGTAQDGVYTVPLNVYQYSAAGVWHVSSFYLQGPNGNVTLSEQDLIARGFATTFTVVVNPCIPHLTGFSFSPGATDVTFADQPVSASISATDPECGIAYVLVTFAAPASCQGPEAKSVLISAPSSGDGHAGVYTGQVVIPRFDVPGAWGATVEVHDNSGDVITLGPSQLQEMGFPGYLSVTSAYSPCQNVTIAGTAYSNAVGGTPVSGVTMTLMEGNGTPVGTAITDGNGHYAFTGLASGTFGVAEAVPAGYAAVSANPGVGSGGTPIGSTQISVLTTTSGATYQPNDFVLRLNSSIAGTVFLYANGGAGVAGVKISLTSGGVAVATTTTDAGGHYSFSQVAPGNYAITETVPVGDTASGSYPDAGSGGTTVSSTVIGVTVAAPKTAYAGNNFVLGKVNTAGCYHTYSQCDLLTPPSCSPAAAQFWQNFAYVYTGGVQIGGQNTILLTCPSAVRCFVPQFLCPSALCRSYVDPTWWCVNDSLAGDVLALQVSVDYSNAGITRNGLASVPGGFCGPLAGLTVGQILRLGNQALGGAKVCVPLGSLDCAIQSILLLCHGTAGHDHD